MNLIEAMADRHLFAPWFNNPATWAAWRAFLVDIAPWRPHGLEAHNSIAFGIVTMPGRSALRIS